MSLPSYLEHYTGSAVFSPYVQDLRTGSGLPLLGLAQPAGDLSDPPTRDLVLVQALDGGWRAEADHGAGRFRHRAAPGDLFVAPPECATQVLIDRPNRLRVLVLPPDTLRDEAGEPTRTDTLARLCAGAFRNEWLAGLLDRLWDQAAGGNAGGQLLADAATCLVASELRRSAGGRPLPPAAGLAPWQVKRVTDHLMDNLASDTALAELAALVRLSPHHFCRAFKASTGLPPHRWRLMRRMERAAELLAGTDLPVTEVASRVGYEDPSHLATAFRKAMGVSPSGYRREHRG